jgi:ABC-type branched-subunit amino acid transport system substrate-binding protein
MRLVNRRPLHLIRRHSSGTILLCALACGGAADTARTPGVSGDTIFIGALTPLSDAVAVIGRPMLAGLTTYFERLNAEQGGVGGKYKVRILAEDITYANPSTGSQKYQKLKDQVALFGMVVGTDQVNGILPLLAEDSVMALPTTFDAEWVRNPNLLPWGVPYQLQAINGVSYALTEGGHAGQTVCSLVLATGYGEATEEGVDFLAKEMGFKVPVKARFKQDDQDFVAPVTQLKNAGCQVVMLAALPNVTGKVLGTAAQLSYAPRWIGTSPSWHHSLAASPLRDYLVKTFWQSWDGPQYGDTSVAGVGAFLAASAKYAPDQKPDWYYVGGYIMAYPVHAVLEQAVATGDLSRAGIRKASTAIAVVSYEGLLGDHTYGAVEQRNPPRTASIFRVAPDEPLGLALVTHGYSAPAAQQFTFERR